MESWSAPIGWSRNLIDIGDNLTGDNPFVCWGVEGVVSQGQMKRQVICIALQW